MLLHLTSVEQDRAQETYGNLRRPSFFMSDAGMEIKRWQATTLYACETFAAGLRC